MIEPTTGPGSVAAIASAGPATGVPIEPETTSWIRRVNRVLLVVSCILIAAALWLVFANVVLRYLFNSPFIWADQFTTYLLFYMTFLAAPWVLAKRGHVSIEVLRNVLRPRGQKLLDVLAHAITAAYFAAFSYLGVSDLIRVVERNAQFADAVEFPQWVVYGALPVGSVLLALQALLNAAEDFVAYKTLQE